MGQRHEHSSCTYLLLSQLGDLYSVWAYTVLRDSCQATSFKPLLPRYARLIPHDFQHVVARHAGACPDSLKSQWLWPHLALPWSNVKSFKRSLYFICNEPAALASVLTVQQGRQLLRQVALAHPALTAIVSKGEQAQMCFESLATGPNSIQ